MNHETPFHPIGKLLAAIPACCFLLSISTSVLAANGPNNLPQQIERIEAKLDQLLAVTNTCTLENFLGGICDDGPVTTTVSFCIDQGSVIDLGLGYELGLNANLELGAGNTTALHASGYGALTTPLVPTVPILVPIPPSPFLLPVPVAVGPPIPTGAGLGAQTSLGKGFSTCMDVPVTVPTDAVGDLRALMAEIDMSYQQRLRNVITLARLTTNRRQFFQCAEDAAAALLTSQILAPADDITGFLGDPAIQQLKDCVDVPPGLQLIMDNPEIVFDRLPDPADLPDASDIFGSYQVIQNIWTRVNNLPTLNQIATKICELLPDAICS